MPPRDPCVNAIWPETAARTTCAANRTRKRRIFCGEYVADGSGEWAALAKCSPDTALRDINELVQIGALQRSAARGRSTSYELAEPAGPLGS